MAQPPLTRPPQGQYPPSKPRKSGRRKPPAPGATPEAPKDDLRPKRGITDRLIVAGLGVIMLLYSANKLVNPPNPSVTNSDGSSIEVPSMADSFAPIGSTDPMWKNPKKGIIEKHFCEGNQNAKGCSDNILHPFINEFERAGVDAQEFIPYLGWDADPRPDSGVIIDQTLHYKNKMSKLLDKE